MKRFIAFFSSLSFFFLAGQTYAAPGIQTTSWTNCLYTPPGGNADPNNGVATLSCIPIILQNLINFLALFAGVVAVFLIIFAGFKFVTSEGDPQKVASARNTLLFVLWGAIVIVASFAIVNLIVVLTGANSNSAFRFL